MFPPYNTNEELSLDAHIGNHSYLYPQFPQSPQLNQMYENNTGYPMGAGHHHHQNHHFGDIFTAQHEHYFGSAGWGGGGGFPPAIGFHSDLYHEKRGGGGCSDRCVAPCEETIRLNVNYIFPLGLLRLTIIVELFLNQKLALSCLLSNF
jgi:hypothetical protein